MKIRPIVTVMNFHALLRAEESRRLAERHKQLENEITGLMHKILGNRNFVLDKKTLKINPKAPELGIYMGSDYGFCGAINAEINRTLAENSDSELVLIGSKLLCHRPVLLNLRRDECDTRFAEIEQLLSDAILSQRYSKIHLCYNHYYNLGRIEPVKRYIYPLDLQEDATQNTEDYLVEGDINLLLQNLAITYLVCGVKIAISNSYASENIVRQNVTSDSLDKIDELEQEEWKAQRKQQNQKAFEKVIDNYMKKKGFDSK